METIRKVQSDIGQTNSHGTLAWLCLTLVTVTDIDV